MEDIMPFEPREGTMTTVGKDAVQPVQDTKNHGAYVGLRRDENGRENGRGSVLLHAHDIINGQRQQQYGNPEDSFPGIAALWNWWLDGRITKPLTAQDVAMMMCLMKQAREKNGAGKTDNVADACGYLALYEDMRGRA